MTSPDAIQASLRHRLINLAQSLLLLCGMGLITWVVVGAIVGPDMTVAMVVGSMLALALSGGAARRLVLAGYGARQLEPDEFPEGHRILGELALRAGLPRPPMLYYVPSQLPNAFAVGNAEDSVVCVTDGLLRLLDLRELRAVLAHEVAHIAHGDLWIMGMADSMTRLVSLASWVGQLILLMNFPLLLIGAVHVPWQTPILLALSPTLMALLQLALSRAREYDADRAGAEISGDPEALASALLKMERHVGRFWEEMFLPGRRMPDPSLLRTHPPTEERVRRLRELAQRIGPPQALPTGLVVLDYPPPESPRFTRFGYWR